MRAYYRSLDGMRGVGIVFVLVYHFLLLSDYDWSVIGFSWVFIQMFFVQSGFLITRMLLDDSHSPLGAYLGRFYWRRVLRIFPVYFGYLLVASLLFLALGIPEDFDRRAPFLFTFTFNFVEISRAIVKVNLWFIHFWSLSVEEQFYVMWPFLVFFLARNMRWLLLALLITAPVFRYWLVDHMVATGAPPELPGRMAYAHTLGQIDALALGAAIPVLRLEERIRHPGRWALALLGILLAVGAANLVSLGSQGLELSWTSLGLMGGVTQNLQHVWSYTLVNLFFMFVILFAIGDSYRGIFLNPVLARMGKLVYGMYVIHMAILILADRVNERYVHSVPLMMVVGFGVTWGLAELSYRYFEQRFLAMKDNPPRLLRKRAAA